ncbi:hydrogen peroxide-inducible genes activator [Pseudoprimorskyibacter insulae]|uniref:Hydrogen peroxide-inducible genes activator n=1 Tax=Pseudoprimorskyibacter insulae TaxID=1695997 RepID=A0A2R8AWR4_9RHOB|nr:hydrogen peroxide-inducible genes activator [Pseudoprimorskyibacter insulae]SPF80428.1 Hydrogen peroxide-inducible genes activator [Pseudoprimorskyibacter insulae]
MTISLKQLTYFKAVADQQNFRRAAEMCHVTQPALSVQIQELERTLGAPLIERTPRAAILTPLGREVLEVAERVLRDVGRLQQQAEDRRGVGRTLRLGVIPTIAPYFLPEALAALRSEDVALDVEVTEGKTDRVLSHLAQGELDAVVMALPVDPEGFAAVPLFEDRFLLAGSAARLDALNVSRLRPEMLSGSQLMLLEDGHCLTDQALEVCGRERTGRINMGASSLATLSRLVGAGFGLTLLPELAVPTERLATPEMRLVRFSDPQPFRQIGLVRRATSSQSDWFTALAARFAEVGQGLVNQARADI